MRIFDVGVRVSSTNVTYKRHKDASGRGEWITRMHHGFIVEDEYISRLPYKSMCL